LDRPSRLLHPEAKDVSASTVFADDKVTFTDSHASGDFPSRVVLPDFFPVRRSQPIDIAVIGSKEDALTDNG
jgi:hypothetical protein